MNVTDLPGLSGQPNSSINNDLLKVPESRPRIFGSEKEVVSSFSSENISGGTSGDALEIFRVPVATTGITDKDDIGTVLASIKLNLTDVVPYSSNTNNFIYYKFEDIALEIQSVAPITASGAIQVAFNPDPANPDPLGADAKTKQEILNKNVALSRSRTVTARGAAVLEPMLQNFNGNTTMNLTNLLKEGGGAHWKFVKKAGYVRMEEFGIMNVIVRAPAVQGSAARFIFTLTGTIRFMGYTRNLPYTPVTTILPKNVIDFSKLYVSKDIDSLGQVYFKINSNKLLRGDIVKFFAPMNFMLTYTDKYGQKEKRNATIDSMLVMEVDSSSTTPELGICPRGLTLGHTEVETTAIAFATFPLLSENMMILDTVVKQSLANITPWEFIKRN